VLVVMAVLLAALGVCRWIAAGNDGAQETGRAEGGQADATTPTLAPTTHAKKMRVEVVESKPHDATVFTQGLEIVGDRVYESGGLVGESVLQTRSWPDLQLLSAVKLDPAEFAEGIAVVPGGELVQLTWKDRVAYVRDIENLAVLRNVEYPEEGWGACFDDSSRQLVTSDGSDVLSFRDPQTLEVLDRRSVTLDGAPLRSLNELECTDAGIYANVWQTDTIVRIEPETGFVDRDIDASGLLSDSEKASADVLNGIAEIDDERFLVTGKKWPRAFVVRFTETQGTEGEG
jgi:glutamine cyclotransferase